MEWKTDALLLRATDYGENDRMATLLTAERGKIGAALKGVKKAGAKLKFAAQPFCFAEYVFAERAGRNTVVSASLHDGFYALREDVGAYYAAAAVCEVCDRLMYEGMVNARLLIAAVSALGEMASGEPTFPLVRFLTQAYALAGYPVTVGECPSCGKTPDERPRFDFASGSFFCSECGAGTPASASTYRVLRAAVGKTPRTPDPDGEKRALRLLQAYCAFQTDEELPALGEYIRMI
ncbi:MAG: DNA repair protein RecO [Candidatus Gallimonas sp.]